MLEKLFLVDQRAAKLLMVDGDQLVPCNYGKCPYIIGVFTPVKFKGRYYWSHDESYKTASSLGIAEEKAKRMSIEHGMPVYVKNIRTRIILYPNCSKQWDYTLITLYKKELLS